ncbi:sigma-54 interaction domain-containing protein [Candidatus Binatus sp.]|uniref:sigma-54 interaction domain-containing protein n=1 Tax=Candidatus Binatus sp. TaxID=2811406 RepID=UPI003CC5CFD4
MSPSDTPEKGGAKRESAATESGPRHYHLLWDEELEALKPVLSSVLEHLGEVIEHWYQLYVLHFGDTRSLSEPEFREIFYNALSRNTKDLLEGDMDRYAINTIRTGELLCERNVPFAEIVASLHLYEESAYTAFPKDSPPPLEIYTTFDKLSHVRMILLADAYFRSASASAGARIQALERQATLVAREKRSIFHGLVGSSASMRRLYDRIEAASGTRGTILIVGESGTGKELVARAIHECGADSAAPFVALNCAAIPKDLIESELFGYRKGAFSGANADYLGLFRAAEGGTLFLDEVTEMAPETQSKLLRAVQERSVRPVGSTRETPVNVRLVASTNRDPEEAVRSGNLRQDLYYRLQAGVLNVSPLRERPDDIPLLVEHFIEYFNEKLQPRIPVRGIEEDAIAALMKYPWPGNVRELSNAIEGAFTFGRSPMIRLQDLPAGVAGNRSAGSLPRSEGPMAQPESSMGTFAEAEREIIARALKSTDGNKVQAAALLRISRKKLYAKIEKYGL